MFKDTKQGQTHYENDGCGDPAHNKELDINDFIKQLKSEIKKRQEIIGNDKRFAEHLFALEELKTIINATLAKMIWHE